MLKHATVSLMPLTAVAGGNFHSLPHLLERDREMSFLGSIAGCPTLSLVSATKRKDAIRTLLDYGCNVEVEASVEGLFAPYCWSEPTGD
jgi:hypothetical protein